MRVIHLTILSPVVQQVVVLSIASCKSEEEWAHKHATLAA